MALAAALMPIVRSLLPPIVPRIELISVDALVLLFALGATAATAVVCGVVPALVAMRGDLLAAVRRAPGCPVSRADDGGADAGSGLHVRDRPS